jgi:hypothetical protein
MRIVKSLFAITYGGTISAIHEIFRFKLLSVNGLIDHKT